MSVAEAPQKTPVRGRLTINKPSGDGYVRALSRMGITVRQTKSPSRLMLILPNGWMPLHDDRFRGLFGIADAQGRQRVRIDEYNRITIVPAYEVTHKKIARNKFEVQLRDNRQQTVITTLTAYGRKQLEQKRTQMTTRMLILFPDANNPQTYWNTAPRRRRRSQLAS